MTSEACCRIPPVESDYQPIGSVENLGGNLSGYVVGDATSKKAVLVFYDIFGNHVNTHQFCDILAKRCGYLVVVPDFFNGKPCTQEIIRNRPVLFEWIREFASFEKILPDVNTTRDWLKAKGVTSAGLVGFCWGAKIAVQVTSVEPFFGAASLIHPSFLQIEDAAKAEAPILVLPSKDEMDMSEFMATLAKKPFGDKCKHHRFDDMLHGFAASRGDYTNELNKQRATEAIQLTADFFTENL